MGVRVVIGHALLATSAAFWVLPAPAWAGATVIEDSPETSAAAASDSPLSSRVSRRAFEIERGGDKLELEYCGNGSTDSANAAVRFVVVVVHGDSRNDCDYASYAVDAANRAGTLAETLSSWHRTFLPTMM